MKYSPFNLLLSSSCILIFIGVLYFVSTSNYFENITLCSTKTITKLTSSKLMKGNDEGKEIITIKTNRIVLPNINVSNDCSNRSHCFNFIHRIIPVSPSDVLSILLLFDKSFSFAMKLKM